MTHEAQAPRLPNPIATERTLRRILESIADLGNLVEAARAIGRQNLEDETTAEQGSCFMAIAKLAEGITADLERSTSEFRASARSASTTSGTR